MYYCLTWVTASFGFGEDIGAIAAWGSGHDVNIIKENDDKAQIMALVCSFFLLLTIIILSAYSYPTYQA